MVTAIKAEQHLTDALTIQAAAAITKRRFIGYDGNHCGANARAVGVSAFDVAASGEQITVYGRGNLVKVTSAGAVSAGAEVASGANGKAVAASALATAAPVVDISKLTIDDTKLTIDAGATPVTSTAANGAIITAAADAMQVAAGFLAAPVVSGGATPQKVNGMAMEAASGADEDILVLLY